MPLSPGTRLGPYEVTAAIGAGGMGEVYRGRDATLNRDVAIKVLPTALAADTERLARFKREAQVLASLNHPNIAHVYGFEGATLPDGAAVHFLAMELVEGEDLSERLKRGAIPVDESIAIAKQIAEGLEEAHEHGIIHRDLKPANIKLTPDGRVKILDFGLAKALEGDLTTTTANSQLSHSPTMSRQMTEAGMIMGTAAYMSPEQARGKTVDKRADIWSFGVVFFEMLTGERLFKGETVSDTLAAVLREELPWARLPEETPPAVARLLRRCLNRDPQRRLRSAADAQMELEEALAAPTLDTGARPDARPGTGRRARRMAAGLLALALAFILGGTWARRTLAPSPEARVSRLRIQLTAEEPLRRVLGANAVLSPDGRTVAMATQAGGTSHLRVRRLEELDATLLAGTEGAQTPFFSPDGRWIGFATADGLMKVGVGGGAPIMLAGAQGYVNRDRTGGQPGRGAAWSGNQIVFAGTNSGILMIPDSGGTPKPLTTLDTARDERSHRWPSFLPGGRTVLFMVQHAGQDYDDSDVEAVSVADGRRTVLVRGGAFPRYMPDGYLLYVRDRVLYGLRFDPERLTVVEPATPLIEGVMSQTGDEVSGNGSAEVSLSDRGDLLYRAEGQAGSYAARGGTDFVWLDEKGKETPAFHEDIAANAIELSPDGQQLAIVSRSARGRGIFIKDMGRGTLTPLTKEGAGDDRPVWSPDGRRIAYMPLRIGPPKVVVRTLDGSAPEISIPVAGLNGPLSWLRDGSALVIGVSQPANDLLLLPLDGSAPRPLADSPASEGQGRVSPDGRWLAFRSNEKGKDQVFVTSLVTPGPHFLASPGIGQVPRWSRDGRSIYFVEPDEASVFGSLMVMSVNLDGPTPQFGTPRKVSDSPHTQSRPSYDLHPDGRVLSIKWPRSETRGDDWSHAILVTGWREEVTRLMSEKK